MEKCREPRLKVEKPDGAVVLMQVGDEAAPLPHHQHSSSGGGGRVQDVRSVRVPPGEIW